MTFAVDPMPLEPAQAVRIIRAEFDQMPGMRLTLGQAARLWHLPESRCAGVLEELVVIGFLVRDPSRRYTRRSSPR